MHCSAAVAAGDGGRCCGGGGGGAPRLKIVSFQWRHTTAKRCKGRGVVLGHI